MCTYDLMNPGFTLIDTCLQLSKSAPGVYAEFGVFKGVSFSRILSYAKSRNKLAYAFDSFVGMAEPVEKDGATIYHKGRFDLGGPKEFINNMQTAGHDAALYVVVEGFIPDTLEQHRHLNFAFARVDMDQYYPTKCTLEYLLPRLHKDSIVVCDDYFEECNYGASLACKEFLRENADKVKIIKVEGRELSWKLIN